MLHEWLASEPEAEFCWQMRGITARMQFLLWRRLSELEARSGVSH